VAKSLRVAFAGGLSDKKLIQKLLPLTLLDGVERIDVFRRRPPPALPKVRWIPLPEHPLMGEAAKLARLLASGWRYDVLIGCFQLYHGLWAHLAGRLWQRPVVQLVITDVAWNYARPAARAAMMGAPACGVRGPQAREALRALGYAGVVAVVHNPFVLPPQSATPDPAAKDFDAIVVGDYAAEKDYPWLLQALHQVRQETRTPAVCFCGRFPAAFQREAEGACAGRAYFPGHLGQRELDAIYVRSRALVMTSSVEGLPMVAVEAMAHGLPVVATSVGELPWLVHQEREGLLVSHGDTAAMAAALGRLAACGEDFVAMGSLARRRVEELAGEFAPGRIAAVWRGIFNACGLSG